MRRHPTSAEGDRTPLVAVPHGRPSRIVRRFGPHTAVTSSSITTLTVSGAPHFLAAVTALWQFSTVVPFCSTFSAEPDTYHAVGIERGIATSSETRPETTSRPITDPVSASDAANNLVVPLRL